MRRWFANLSTVEQAILAVLFAIMLTFDGCAPYYDEPCGSDSECAERYGTNGEPR